MIDRISVVGKVSCALLDAETVSLLQDIPDCFKNERCTEIGSQVEVCTKMCISGKIVDSTLAKRVKCHNSILVAFTV